MNALIKVGSKKSLNTMRYKSVILWGLFGAILLSGILYTLHAMPGDTHTPLLDFNEFNPGKILILSLATLLLVIHAAWTIGVPSGIILVALGFVFGLAFEIAGMAYGTVFGGHYIYNIAIKPSIMGVPWLIPLIWSGFIYIGYTIVSSFNIWINSRKHSHILNGFSSSIIFAFLTAFVVLAIDLLMEPLQVNAGTWKWLDYGYYYDIPSGNFLGWFLLTFTTILTFKIIQKFLKTKTEKMAPHVLLIPVVGYGILYLILTFWAYRLKLIPLIVIGSVTMLPIAVIAMFTHIYWRVQENKSTKQYGIPNSML
jgi:putative membrane protein